MMKETNIHSQVTSTIAGDDGEAMAKSEGYVAENGFHVPNPCNYNSNKKVNARAAYRQLWQYKLITCFFEKMLDVLTAENQ